MGRLASVMIAAIVGVALVSVPAVASAATEPAERVALPLREAVAALPVADEVRDGYDRKKYNHWIDADRDGCSTRAEVLIDEAATTPEVGAKCVITGGSWYSSYDDVYVTDAKGSDIDHMVPLAESWDSGASAWTAIRREAYANDLDEPRALIAVTAKSNRSKADQDPSTWLPPYVLAHCGYIADWTAVKTRWGLTVDAAEKAILVEKAASCPNVPIVVTIA